MKKTLVMMIALVMVLSVGAQAYIFKAKLTGADGTGGGELQIGDLNTSSQGWNAPPGDYCTIAANVDGAWKVRDFQKPAPAMFTAFAWATPGYGQETGILKLYLSNEGNDGTLGAPVIGQTWAIYDAQGAVLASAVISGVGSATNPAIEIVVPLVSTATPFESAAVYGIGAVPEPGSIVAMMSGLVGLVGFGIRRRK